MGRGTSCLEHWPVPLEIISIKYTHEIVDFGGDRGKSRKTSKTSTNKQPYDADSGNPLSLVIRKARAQSGKYMMHLLDASGKAIGCGWKPATGNWENLSPEEFNSSAQDYSQCSKCFRCHSIPDSLAGQSTGACKDSDEEYTSCGSLSDDSVDSDSDAEASKLALK